VLAGKRTVVAHLGSGASLCAMRDGRSIDTTMGFTPLDGVMMSTRCGTIDPGILLYLQRERGLSAQELEQILYHNSGLLGVSGISGDMRMLLSSSDPRAAEAIDLFTFEVAKAVCAMAVTLQGLDCLVFTGGIGEHAAKVRALVCNRLRWLGLELDPKANDGSVGVVSPSSSSVEIRVIPTSEEIGRIVDGRGVRQRVITQPRPKGDISDRRSDRSPHSGIGRGYGSISIPSL
jgi:acetate kinase